jgi:hypothetical protein
MLDCIGKVKGRLSRDLMKGAKKGYLSESV